MPRSKNLCKCEYCGKSFIHIERHRCKYVERFENINTPVGALAIELWRRFYIKNRIRFTKGDIRLHFIKNVLYNNFIKLSQFIYDTNISKPFAYLNYIMNNKLPSTLWSKEITYQQWLLENILLEEPKVALQRSLITIVDTCKELNLNYKDFFDKVSDNRIFNMVISGKVSPFLIFSNENIKNKTLNKLKYNGENIALRPYIGNEYYWKAKLNINDEELLQLKNIINEEFN